MVILPADCSPRSGLNKSEDIIMECTKTIIRQLQFMPKTSGDQEAIVRAVHDIQCIIATNALARLFPTYWVTPGIAGDSEE